MAEFDYSGRIPDWTKATVSEVLDVVRDANAAGDYLDGNFYELAVRNLSVDLPSGVTPLFYAGSNPYRRLRGHEAEAWKTARDLANTNPTVFQRLDDTELGQFINSTDVEDAIQMSQDNKQVITGVDWSKGEDPRWKGERGDMGWISSQRFAENVSGDVMVLTEGAGTGSYLRSIELETLKNNTAVNQINGIDRIEVRDGFTSETDRYNAVANNFKTFASAWLFDGLKVTGYAGRLSTVRRFENLALENRIADLNLTPATFGNILGNARVLSAAGVVGDVLHVAFAFEEARQLYVAGNEAGAEQLIFGTFGDLAGSAVGTWVATAAALAVAAPEPLTTAGGIATLAVIAYLGGTIGGNAGAEFGAGAVKLLQDNANGGNPLVLDDIVDLYKSYAENELEFKEGEYTVVADGDELKIIPISHCFTAGTMIDMWPLDSSIRPGPDGLYDEAAVRANIWQKAIEEITPTDTVVAFDAQGNLKPGNVTRTMTNEAKIILDLHGTFVTPGHVYWCAGGKYEGQHVPIIDILRDDGVIQRQDGTLVRATTGCEVGSPDDEEFWAFKLYEDSTGSERVGDKTMLRFGTRWMMPNGQHLSMREYMESAGIEILKDGPHKGYALWKQTGIIMPFVWVLSESLPKPEDFVLARSATSLEDIYKASEWEAVHPTMPPPLQLEDGSLQLRLKPNLELMPRNEPIALRSTDPDQQTAPNQGSPVIRDQGDTRETNTREAVMQNHSKGTTLH